MTLYIYCNCKDCGYGVDVVYDIATDSLREIRCGNCGNKATASSQELVRHSLDSLATSLDRINFKPLEATFVGQNEERQLGCIQRSQALLGLSE